MIRSLLLALLLFGIQESGDGLAQGNANALPDVATVTSAAKDLCGGNGTSTDLHVKGTTNGMVILDVARGPVVGTVEFSKSE